MVLSCCSTCVRKLWSPETLFGVHAAQLTSLRYDLARKMWSAMELGVPRLTDQDPFAWRLVKCQAKQPVVHEAHTLHRQRILWGGSPIK